MGSELAQAAQNRVAEWSFDSERMYNDPCNEVSLETVFTDPDGAELRVPAFWRGGSRWGLRVASPKTGRHRFRTVCSDTANPDPHDQKGVLQVTAYRGDNPLFVHGPLHVSQDRRHLGHRDGAPFFWLGDTWWLCLTKRLPWSDGFQALTSG